MEYVSVAVSRDVQLSSSLIEKTLAHKTETFRELIKIDISLFNLL